MSTRLIKLVVVVPLAEVTAHTLEVSAFVKLNNKGVLSVGDKVTDSIFKVIEDLVAKRIFHESVLEETLDEEPNSPSPELHAKTAIDVITPYIVTYRCTSSTLLYL